MTMFDKVKTQIANFFRALEHKINIYSLSKHAMQEGWVQSHVDIHYN